MLLQDKNLHQVKKKPYLLLVWTLLFSTILNATYAIMRWLTAAGYFSIDGAFLNEFRNTMVVFMAISILAGILLSRREAPKQKRDQHPLIPGLATNASFGYILFGPIASVFLVIAFIYLRKRVKIDFAWEKGQKELQTTPPVTPSP